MDIVRDRMSYTRNTVITCVSYVRHVENVLQTHNITKYTVFIKEFLFTDLLPVGLVGVHVYE